MTGGQPPRRLRHRRLPRPRFHPLRRMPHPGRCASLAPISLEGGRPMLRYALAALAVCLALVGAVACGTTTTPEGRRRRARPRRRVRTSAPTSPTSSRPPTLSRSRPGEHHGHPARVRRHGSAECDLGADVGRIRRLERGPGGAVERRRRAQVGRPVRRPGPSPRANRPSRPLPPWAPPWSRSSRPRTPSAPTAPAQAGPPPGEVTGARDSPPQGSPGAAPGRRPSGDDHPSLAAVSTMRASDHPMWRMHAGIRGPRLPTGRRSARDGLGPTFIDRRRPACRRPRHGR